MRGLRRYPRISKNLNPVFISYTHSDSAIADPIEWSLKKSEYTVWRDINETRAGKILSQEVVEAIEDCSFFITIVTPAFDSSDWLENELTKAIECGKPIIAIICGSGKIPIQLGSRTRIHVKFAHGKIPAKDFATMIDSLESALGDPCDSSCEDDDDFEYSATVEGELSKSLADTRWSWCENTKFKSTGMTIKFRSDGSLIRSWRTNPTRWRVTSNGFVRFGCHVLLFDLEAKTFQGCSARKKDAPGERSGHWLSNL